MGCFRRLLAKLRPSQNKRSERTLEIGYPTNFKREETMFPGVGLSDEQESLIRERAMNETGTPSSKIERVRQHVRNASLTVMGGSARTENL
ncbi:MAG: hypothetical protein M1827_002393 [Pycnora praestabilis]|nr:MAG: hypothetical protein M1827_002393 [Pycnora praestabilis]